MSIAKKVLSRLILEHESRIDFYNKSITTLKNLLKALPKKNIIERDSIKQGINALENQKYFEIANRYIPTIDDEVIKNLDYLYDIANEDIKDVFEVFLEFTLMAYLRLQHPNTIEPKKLYNIDDYLSTEERHQAKIFTTNEILYELYELLNEYGCDKDTARALQSCISDNKRLPKEPIFTREAQTKLGQYILKNK